MAWGGASERRCQGTTTASTRFPRISISTGSSFLRRLSTSIRPMARISRSPVKRVESPSPVGLPVGNHRPARHEADLLSTLEDPESRPGDPLSPEGERHDDPRQVPDRGVILILDLLEGGKLGRQGLPSDERALQRGKAHGETGQRTGKDRDLRSGRILPQFMAEKGKARLEPQGVARPQPHRRRPFLQEEVPEPRGIGGGEKTFKTQGLPRVAGPGDEDLLSRDGHGAEGVLERLRQNAAGRSVSWRMAREAGPWREIIAIASETSSICASGKAGKHGHADSANRPPGWRH